jgi:hypothetical protein
MIIETRGKIFIENAVNKQWWCGKAMTAHAHSFPPLTFMLPLKTCLFICWTRKKIAGWKENLCDTHSQYDLLQYLKIGDNWSIQNMDGLNLVCAKIRLRHKMTKFAFWFWLYDIFCVVKRFQKCKKLRKINRLQLGGGSPQRKCIGMARGQLIFSRSFSN